MPEMPSVNMSTMTTTMSTSCPIREPDFNILSKDVENLVSEIKENLRLSTGSTTMKSLSCSQISRKSSRASPYLKPGKLCCDPSNPSSSNCVSRLSKRKSHEPGSELTEDPYELLQKLLRDGSLVSEAVRRVKLGLSPKQRYFYDSDDDCKTPILRLFPKEN